MKKYLRNILIALDQLLNAILLGDPTETISSRAGKAMKAGKRWGCLLCRFLSLIQKDHCQKSVELNTGADGVLPD